MFPPPEHPPHLYHFYWPPAADIHGSGTQRVVDGEGLGGDRPIHTINNMCVSDQFFWDQTLIMNCVTLIRNHEMSCMLKQKFKFKFFNDSISTYLPCIIIF